MRLPDRPACPIAAWSLPLPLALAVCCPLLLRFAVKREDRLSAQGRAFSFAACAFSAWRPWLWAIFLMAGFVALSSRARIG